MAEEKGGMREALEVWLRSQGIDPEKAIADAKARLMLERVEREVRELKDYLKGG